MSDTVLRSEVTARLLSTAHLPPRGGEQFRGGSSRLTALFAHTCDVRLARDKTRGASERCQKPSHSSVRRPPRATLGGASSNRRSPLISRSQRGAKNVACVKIRIPVREIKLTDVPSLVSDSQISPDSSLQHLFLFSLHEFLFGHRGMEGIIAPGKVLNELLIASHRTLVSALVVLDLCEAFNSIGRHIRYLDM